MNTTAKIIIGVLLGGLITFCLLWQIEGCNYKKQITTLNSRIANCENAPVTHDTIWRHDTVIINKVKVLTSVKTDTVIVNGHMVEVNSYKDTLKTKDFDLAYGVKTIGVLKEVEFPSYTIHSKEIITYKTVDTCFAKKPAYTPKNHIGIDIDLLGSNLKQFPNVGGTFFWSIMDKWKINVGGEYNTYHNELYAKLGIGIYLK